MKDILIALSPTKNQYHPVYTAIQKGISKHSTTIQQLLYTTFLISGPKSFECAMLIVNIADQHGFDTAVFEVESVLKYPASKTQEENLQKL